VDDSLYNTFGVTCLVQMGQTFLILKTFHHHVKGVHLNSGDSKFRG